METFFAKQVRVNKKIVGFLWLILFSLKEPAVTRS